MRGCGIGSTTVYMAADTGTCIDLWPWPPISSDVMTDDDAMTSLGSFLPGYFHFGEVRPFLVCRLRSTSNSGTSARAGPAFPHPMCRKYFCVVIVFLCVCVAPDWSAGKGRRRRIYESSPKSFERRTGTWRTRCLGSHEYKLNCSSGIVAQGEELPVPRTNRRRIRISQQSLPSRSTSG